MPLGLNSVGACVNSLFLVKSVLILFSFCVQMVACKLEFSFRCFKRMHLSFYSWPCRCLPFSIFGTSTTLIERHPNTILHEVVRETGKFRLQVPICPLVYTCSNFSEGWWMKMHLDLSNMPYIFYSLLDCLKSSCYLLSEHLLFHYPFLSLLLFFILFNKYHEWTLNISLKFW